MDEEFKPPVLFVTLAIAASAAAAMTEALLVFSAANNPSMSTRLREVFSTFTSAGIHGA